MRSRKSRRCAEMGTDRRDILGECLWLLLGRSHVVVLRRRTSGDSVAVHAVVMFRNTTKGLARACKDMAL